MQPPLKPLTVRSLVLSLMLAAPDRAAPSRQLVGLCGELGIAPNSVRVALSRMVRDGDLTTTRSTYRLTDRHRRRRSAQEADLHPAPTAYDGTWHLVIVTAAARTARQRSAWRTTALRHRFAELREGVWTRPATLPAPASESATSFPTQPEDPRALLDFLWDLPAWASRAEVLTTELAAPNPDLRERFVVAAAAVRHLRSDPVPPTELLDDPWPAPALHAAYGDFTATLTERWRHWS